MRKALKRYCTRLSVLVALKGNVQINTPALTTWALRAERLLLAGLSSAMLVNVTVPARRRGSSGREWSAWRWADIPNEC